MTKEIKETKERLKMASRIIQTRADKATEEALAVITEKAGINNVSDIIKAAIQQYSKQFPPYNSLSISLEEKDIEILIKHANEKNISLNDYVTEIIQREIKLIKNEIDFKISKQDIKTVQKILNYIQTIKE